MTTYADFLASKGRRAIPVGFTVTVDHPALFPFQRHCVTWALRQGRAALFEDTGLGKTLQELVWARHVVEHTGRPVLILAPLAVAGQTVREAAKFGLGCVQIRDGSQVAGPGVYVTNYDRLHLFDASAFGGVVLDESSILKSFSGPTKQALCEAFAATPYRLCCTATPAPNDHLELGNHSEFLGVLTSHRMISRWFINDTSTFGTYRLKGHAVRDFWDWVCSWARCVGRPSDLGQEYSDEGYVLPELRIRHHSIAVDRTEGRADGQLFREVEASATALHQERRRTVGARAARVAELVAAEPDEAWILWADTDYDADEVAALVPEAVEVHGGQDAEVKIARLMDFAEGRTRILLTKPKLAGMGLNFQQCARMAFVGPNHSYEALYQAIRRCWRFGQARPVEAHIVLASTEHAVWSTLDRKSDDHEAMKVEMFAAARRAQARRAALATYDTKPCPVPAWLTESA